MALVGKQKLEGTKEVMQVCMKTEESGDNMLNCSVFIKEAKRIFLFKTELKEQPVTINKAETVLYNTEEINDAEQEEEKVSMRISSNSKRRKVEVEALDNAEIIRQFEKLSQLYIDQSAKLDNAVTLYIKQ
eukprot:TRINITY_DN6514_c0_g2_i4.p3 TRINITY_DN6514_c0_g2~~TRINITY_DN6514_c0_g2_i4.p3  ORF type:complete len:131 (+),score=36.31 TRINITY_DN6514_c0_g2_i4:1142-1534(+)